MDLTDTKVKCVAPSEVTCLSVAPSMAEEDVEIVIGCRDHAIRTFRHSFFLPPTQISPALIFQPPHLDTVKNSFYPFKTCDK